MASPLPDGFEHALGGFADALGLRPWRSFSQACVEACTAAFAAQVAQAHYLALVGSASTQGMGRLYGRLGAMAGNGEGIPSSLAFLRLWTNATEQALHEALQSESGLRASADLLRARMQSRKHVNHAVSIFCESINVPTQANLDEAYREIQVLKREVQRLKKARRAA